MTLQQVLIMIVGTANAIGMYLNIIGNRYGWAVVCIAQFAFGTYLWVTHQWHGAAQFLCFGMSLYGFHRWTMRGVHSDRVGASSLVAPIVNGLPIFKADTLPLDLVTSLNATVSDFAKRHATPEAA
jgi:hypothetical protein